MVQCGKKYFTAGQATNDIMAYARYILDTLGYKDTLRICNTGRFFIATMVTRTRLNVAFYI